MTPTALAQKLSLSRTAVQARMARLERDGVIAGYRAVLGVHADPDAEEGLEAILGLTYNQRPCAPVVAVVTSMFLRLKRLAMTAANPTSSSTRTTQKCCWKRTPMWRCRSPRLPS